jgi:chromosome segregation ATPase
MDFIDYDQVRDDLLEAEREVENLRLTVEGLGQANTELAKQLQQTTDALDAKTELASQLQLALDRELVRSDARVRVFKGRVHSLANDIRALREVPIGVLDQAIADVVQAALEIGDR